MLIGVLLVVALQCTGTMACSSGGSPQNAHQNLQATLANVDEIFKLSLREPKMVLLNSALQVYTRSVGLNYNSVGRCTEYQNKSISCWTQVMRADFEIFAGVNARLNKCYAHRMSR